MVMSTQVNLIHGTQYTKAGKETLFSFKANRIGATTPGNKGCVRKKLDGNEDSMAYQELAEGELLLVADSHYGSLASVYAVDHFATLLEPHRDAFSRRLLRVHYQLDDLIRAERVKPEHKSQAQCATTLVSVLLSEGRLHYASTGDSRLWLVRDDRMIDILGVDEVGTLFLGDQVVHLFQFSEILMTRGITNTTTDGVQLVEVLIRIQEISHLLKRGRATEADLHSLTSEIAQITKIPFPLSVTELREAHRFQLDMMRLLPQGGSLPLHEGDVILLASDGIDELESDCSFERVFELIGDTSRSLEKRASQLMSACTGRKGGNDNLTFLLAQC